MNKYSHGNRRSLYLCLSASPDRPVGPLKVSDRRFHKLSLSWKPPVIDGGSPVTSYIVSKQRIHVRRRGWVDDKEEEIGRTKETQYRVIGVEPDTRYMFYVRAENSIGTSLAIEVSLTLQIIMLLAWYVFRMINIQWHRYHYKI